jgi:hypothetical protein
VRTIEAAARHIADAVADPYGDDMTGAAAENLTAVARYHFGGLAPERSWSALLDRVRTIDNTLAEELWIAAIEWGNSRERAAHAIGVRVGQLLGTRARTV